jgi:hypothetical protein
VSELPRRFAMRRAHMRGALLLVALVTTAIALPGAGHSKPPETDGSVYSWFGAATLSVDVKPWGGGYVRSDPYLIDCPMACIRPFESGREVTLTAYTTPGHKFESWEGPCAGQGNPCKVKLAGAVEVTAVYSGQFVPPAPPPPPPAPAAPPASGEQPPSGEPPVVDPVLTVDVTAGDCQPRCFNMAFTGTGYHPNSDIDITFSYVVPGAGSATAENARTSDATGGWSAGFFENCLFGENGDEWHEGPVQIDVTATDAEGASASTHVSGVCPAQPAPPT